MRNLQNAVQFVFKKLTKIIYWIFFLIITKLLKLRILRLSRFLMPLIFDIWFSLSFNIYKVTMVSKFSICVRRLFEILSRLSSFKHFKFPLIPVSWLPPKYISSIVSPEKISGIYFKLLFCRESTFNNLRGLKLGIFVGSVITLPMMSLFKEVRVDNT